MRWPVKSLILPFCLICAQHAHAENVCETECVESSEVFEGIEYCHKQSSTQQVFILKVDLQADGIRPFVTPNLDGKKMITSKFLSQYKVQTAINTAFFDKDNTDKAYGIEKSDGASYGLTAKCSATQTCNLDTQTPSNFACATDQGCTTIGFDQNNNYLQTWAYDSEKETIQNQMYNATSGGVILVKDGHKVMYTNTTKAPRTVVGIDKTGRYFTMVVVDGRRTNRVGMTYTELGDCLLSLGVYQGVNMDGGGSSTMVIQGKGVLNSPSDGSERPDPVHLGFFANAAYHNTSEDYLVQNTDVDGDGTADVCARGKAGIYCALSKTGKFTSIELLQNSLTNDSGWTDETNYATIRFADINGDGLADVCARTDKGVTCWPFNGTKFGSGLPQIDMADTAGYNRIQYYSTIQFADINGDGRDDMCARYKDGFRCYPSLESGWGEAIVISDMSDSNGWNQTSWYSTIRMGDINNDGKVDVCGRNADGYYCWLSDGDKFRDPFKAADWSDENAWHHAIYYSTIRLADINGDHQMDLCAHDKDGIVCHLSNGDSMSDSIRGPELDNKDNWNDISMRSTLRFGDFNGDGKDDMCIRTDAGIQCYPSNGNGFDDAFLIDEISNANGWNLSNQYRTIRMGDINGDGKQEICGRNANLLICFSFTGTGFEKINGYAMNNASGWDKPHYFSTLRIGGPFPKPCSLQNEICDEKDNNCNGQIDENDICSQTPECIPSEEVCDGIDNDCDDEIDEDGVCIQTPECVPSDEICDGKDNDCDDEIDEDGVCECENGNCHQPVPPVENLEEGDCGCSLSRTPNAPAGAAVAGLFLLGGLLLRRRRNQ